MPRHDEDEYDNPGDDERYNRSRYADERDAQRHAGGYSRGGQSEGRRDRTPERQSSRREIEYQSIRKGKERESSPLNFNPNYMDDPIKHRYRSPDGSKRRETAAQLVEEEFGRTDNVSGDNQRALRDRDRAQIESRDFAEGGRRPRYDVEHSASERKHDESRDKGKQRRR